MKILVTGAAGFVGTNLLEYLSSRHGWELVGIDIAEPKERIKGVEYYGVDLLDWRSLDGLFLTEKGIDAILHFAAQARVGPSYTDPIGTYRTNVHATIELLSYARTKGIRFIVASSEIIYGKADEYPCREHFHLRPDSPYAASKAALDLMVQQLPNTVVIRSGMGYGPRSPPIQVITKFLLKCMDGKSLSFPGSLSVLHPTRDVNYIGNFVRGIEQVLEHPEVSGVFNMGSGQETNILDIAKACVDTVKNGRIQFDADFHYRPGEEGKRTWLDNSKAHEAFGYDPRIRLQEGLERTYQWLKNGGRELYGW